MMPAWGADPWEQIYCTECQSSPRSAAFGSTRQVWETDALDVDIGSADHIQFDSGCFAMGILCDGDKQQILPLFSENLCVNLMMPVASDSPMGNAQTMRL